LGSTLDRIEELILQLGGHAPRPLLTVDDPCQPRLRARRGPRPEEDEVARIWLQRSQLVEMTRLKRIYYLYSASVSN
jgi:hypothetical protein